MYYLVDTTPENGCLRVLAGSHLKRHPVHDNPLFQLLSDGLRAHIGRPRPQPESWPSQAWKRVTPLLPVYEGGVEPVAWNRVPGPELR